MAAWTLKCIKYTSANMVETLLLSFFSFFDAESRIYLFFFLFFLFFWFSRNKYLLLLVRCLLVCVCAVCAMGTQVYRAVQFSMKMKDKIWTKGFPISHIFIYRNRNAYFIAHWCDFWMGRGAVDFWIWISVHHNIMMWYVTLEKIEKP